MFLHFIYAFFATVGFCFIFNVPRRHIFSAASIGAIGWTIFQYIQSTGSSSILACFIGSCVIALLSDICSRLFKDASTIFVIPGILPLVPGAGMYNTMVAFLDGDFSRMSIVGWETALMAGSIAVALLIMASLIKITMITKNGILKLFVKNPS